MSLEIWIFRSKVDDMTPKLFFRDIFSFREHDFWGFETSKVENK